MSYESNLSYKISEYGKYRDSQKATVSFNGFKDIPCCWDIEHKGGVLTFKTRCIFSGKVTDMKVVNFSMMPAAAASYNIVTVKTDDYSIK